MNRVILMGRLTRDPEIRYSQTNQQMAIARYSLAVDRPVSRDAAGADQPTTDFINCVAFGRTAEFAERYLKKGTKIAVEGRIQTGSYTNKDGQKVYTTDIVIDRHEFCESRNAASQNGGFEPAPASFAPVSGGGMNEFQSVPEGIDEELPFG